jgi:hypothetical protein
MGFFQSVFSGLAIRSENYEPLDLILLDMIELYLIGE